MKKKILSLLGCLAPLGAWGYTLVPDTATINLNPGNNTSVGGADLAGIAIPGTASSMIIQSGRGLTIGALYDNVGLSMSGNIYIGYDASVAAANGDLIGVNGPAPYGILADVFALQSNGNINVGGNINVADGYYLTIGTTGDVATAPINVTVGGNISGRVSMNDVATLTAGNVIGNSAAIDIRANSATLGTVTTARSTLNLDVTNTLTVDGIDANASTVDVTAGALNVGAGGVVVKNPGAKLNLNSVGNMNIDGVLDAGVDSYLTAGGVITLGAGWNIGAGVSNFSLIASNLVMSNRGATLAALFANNNMDSLTIKLSDGDIGNGESVVNGVSNSGADMDIVGNNINFGDVTNNAQMGLSATGGSITVGNLKTAAGADTALLANVGDVTVSGAINVGADSNNVIRADGDVTVSGAVNNSGALELKGNTIDVASIENLGAGATIKIHGGDDAVTEVVKINGNLSNGGALVAGGEIDIDGVLVDIDGVLTGNGGTTDILAYGGNAGALKIGTVTSNTGVLNLSVLSGVAQIDNDININTNGTINFADRSFPNVTSEFAGVQVGGSVYVAGDLTLSNAAATGSGNMNINTTSDFILSAGDTIEVMGDFIVTDNVISRHATLSADSVTIRGDVTSGGLGHLILGGANNDGGQKITVGNVTAQNGGVIEINAGTIGFDSVRAQIAQLTEDDGKIYARGDIAASDTVTINNGIWDVTDTTPTSGLFIRPGESLSIASQRDVTIYNGIDLGAAQGLSLSSANALTATGVVKNAGDLELVAARELTFGTNANITNSGNVTLSAGTELLAGDVAMGNLVNNAGNFTVYAGAISADAVDVGGGLFTVDVNLGALKPSLDINNLTVHGNGRAVLNVSDLSVDNVISVDGDAMIGVSSCTGALCINGDGNSLISVTANSLQVSGDFYVNNEMATYDIATDFRIGGTLYTESGVDMTFDTPWTYVGGIDSDGTLSFRNNGMTSTGMVRIAGTLHQNYDGVLADGDMNLVSNDFRFDGAEFKFGGNVNVDNVSFVMRDSDDLLDITVGGNLNAGAVDFIGLERLSVGGNFTINPNTYMNIIANPGAPFWATVDALGGAFGVTTPAIEPLISIGGDLIFQDTIVDSENFLTISLFDIADTSNAIHFMSVDGTIESGDQTLDEIIASLGKVTVQFCNADGSVCFDYLNPSSPVNGLNPDEPLLAWIAVNDFDSQNIYILFNSILESRSQVFLIQPVVAAVPGTNPYTIDAAGALDDLLAGKLYDTLFYHKQPLQLVELVYRDTPLATFAHELFERMNYYDVEQWKKEDGQVYDVNADIPLAEFSRLVRPREIEQLAGLLNLNEHVTFRSMEDRFIDEFIWNRNRKLKKAWADAEFGILIHDDVEGDSNIGNRFALTGGFDWQSSNTLILGLTGHVSHATSGDISDSMDLSYGGVLGVLGHYKTNVSDTNIGIGGYMMKTLGEKYRAYGNASLDAHILNVNRDQTFVDTIKGTGTTFAITGEFGLMHDWLYQYVVGNAYLRLGYNTGIDVTTSVDDYDYMQLRTDGYTSVTPGYSLTAQKRVYTSSWFQFRPYVTIGAEYDVVGMDDVAEYKFADAYEFTTYDVDVSPLWLNAGTGVEFLSATGVHFGFDYRYQYNNVFQLHNIRASAMYRF